MAQVHVDLEHGGLGQGVLERHASALREAMADLDAAPAGEFLRVLGRRDLLRQIRSIARERSARLTDVVQLGIGGSSLGAQALCAALLPARYNETVRRPGLRFHFPDNIDPESFAALLDRLNPATTLVHVVSKSGGTLETAAQLHALLEHWRRRGKRFSMAARFVVTTGASGTLREWADAEGIPILDAPDDVPGRYSVFTSSGLLVPALCGVAVEKVLAGARRMLEFCRADGLGGPAGQLASLSFEHDRTHGRGIHVEMIYADALLLAGAWFNQIWAESLGKNGRGPTPVVARGTTDQHSQIQLYVGGPDDKLYTIVRVARYRRGLPIGRGARPSVIAGRTLSAVFDAEAQGTIEALVERGRPLVQIRLERIAPDALGEFMLMQQLQTALAGALYGVDPFTQPGVEAGKIAAMRVLSGGSRPG